MNYKLICIKDVSIERLPNETYELKVVPLQETYAITNNKDIEHVKVPQVVVSEKMKQHIDTITNSLIKTIDTANCIGLGSSIRELNKITALNEADRNSLIETFDEIIKNSYVYSEPFIKTVRDIRYIIEYVDYSTFDPYLVFFPTNDEATYHYHVSSDECVEAINKVYEAGYDAGAEAIERQCAEYADDYLEVVEMSSDQEKKTIVENFLTFASDPQESIEHVSNRMKEVFQSLLDELDSNPEEKKFYGRIIGYLFEVAEVYYDSGLAKEE